MKIDFGPPHQRPALMELWQVAFGDTPAFIHRFFETAYVPSRCRCVTVAGELAAALYWFDVACEGQKMAYIYAVATAPAWRGRGLCRKLMADTHACLAQDGYHGALLVPEGETLRRMYRSFGYKNCTTLREFAATAGDAPLALTPLHREDFARLRRELLPHGALLQENENLAYLETFAQFYAGEGCLAVLTQNGNQVFCPEILGDPDQAPGILRALGAAEGTFRCPGAGMDFAMFLPLHPDAVTPRYFAFAFD